VFLKRKYGEKNTLITVNQKKMKLLLLVCFTCMANMLLFGQNTTEDSLKKALALHPQEDTARVNLLLAFGASLEDKDYAQKEVQEAIGLATKLKWAKGEAIGWKRLSYLQIEGQKFDAGISSGINALEISEEIKDSDLICSASLLLGQAYGGWANDSLAEYYLKKSLEIAKAKKDKHSIGLANSKLGDFFCQKSQWDKAAAYSNEALKTAIELHDNDGEADALFAIGEQQAGEHNFKDALASYKQALIIKSNQKNYHGAAYAMGGISNFFCGLKNRDSALYYANAALRLSKEHNLIKELSDSYMTLVNVATAFQDYKDALAYHLILDSLNHKTYSLEAARNIERATEKVQQDKKDAVAKAEQEKKDADTQRIRNIQYFAIGTFLLITIFLFWNNRQKQKSKAKIQNAYAELKATQSQLIHSEKMASLGELTAGIAHEIQNPLNFVNNFSEVSNELIDEMKNELSKGNYEDVGAIADDVKRNLEKINHHGKRADAIVKGMLQHSRASSGLKEPTDINKLADEYLRLSYHGMRAKDKSFNAEFKTGFDESIGKINVVPQDIGRVLLNLFNNAFYAVNEKKQKLNGTFEPVVTVSTKKENGSIILKVSDNGNGIPLNIVDKVFQPFFTTKLQDKEQDWV
jgi:signal transduction histidine kinase